MARTVGKLLAKRNNSTSTSILPSPPASPLPRDTPQPSREKGKRKVIPKKQFEFDSSHKLYSEQTQKYTDKIKNRKYQQVFKKNKKSDMDKEKDMTLKKQSQTISRQKRQIEKLKNEIRNLKKNVK